MNKLLLSPTAAGFAATPGTEVVMQSLDGGAGRYRLDVLGATYRVNVKWVLRAFAYDYLRAFIRFSINSGADAFEIDLSLDYAETQTYVAHLIPGTLKLDSRSGEIFTVSAQLEVEQSAVDSDRDQTIVALYETAALGGPNIVAGLEILVNEELPEGLGI